MTWRDDAACLNHPDPDQWFADRSETDRIQEAKKICLSCPVRRECATDAEARDERWGIFAGYQTSVEKEWEQLIAYLAIAPKTQSKRRRLAQPKVRFCSKCGDEFATRRVNLTQCPPCVNNLVDAGPSDQRIRDLLALGCTRIEIAAMAGIPRNGVGKVLQQRYIAEKTARAILSVEVRGLGVPA